MPTISAILRFHLGESRRLAERAAVVITPSQLARRRIGPIGDCHVAARRCLGEFGEFIRREADERCRRVAASLAWQVG